MEWLKEQRESLNNTLITSPLNSNREDLSDIIRGKIIQLDEILKLKDALKSGATAEEVANKIRVSAEQRS